MRFRHWTTLTVIIALLALGAIAIYGFRVSPIFSQVIWYPKGLDRARRFLLLFGLLFVPVITLAGRYFKLYTGILLFLATVIAVGPVAPCAVLLILLSATVIGRLLITTDALIAALIGFAVMIAAEEILVRLPWNYWWVYVAFLVAPLAAAPKSTRNVIAATASLLRPNRFSSLSERCAALMLTFIATAHWLMVLKPEVSTDGLAMHLAIADGIAWKHVFPFDVAHNVWAVMPMGGDWCFTIASVIGGEFAARLLNLAFLGITAGLLFLTCRRFLERGPALWITALFLTTPLVQLVTGSLFIENILTAFLFGAASALWRYEDISNRRFLFAAFLLLGTALHVKFGSLAFAIPGLCVATAQIWRKRRVLGPNPVLTCSLLAAVFLAAACPPYLVAEFKTRDPIFPFLNNRFHSPALKAGLDLREPRYHEPLRFSTLFDLTFFTHTYYEGENGSFGLQYLVLLPVGLVLLFRRRNYTAWTAAAIGIGGSIIILLTQPNIRYLYPALPFLHVVIAQVFIALPLVPSLLIWTYFAVIFGLNTYLFPTSNWYNKDFYSSPLLTARGRRNYLAETEPRRLLIEDMGWKHPGEVVLMFDETLITGFRSPVLRYHWHDQTTFWQIAPSTDTNDLLTFIAKHDVRQFLMPANYGALESPVIQRFDKECFEPEEQIGTFAFGGLNADCGLRVAQLRRHQGDNMAVYEDNSAYLDFQGDWARAQRFPPASGQTVSYSDAPGSSVKFSFAGSQVTYLYTAAANRGYARIKIDGRFRQELDLYSSTTRWQTPTVFDGLGDGRHTIEVSVAGRARPESTGRFVDVDAFLVPKSN